MATVLLQVAGAAVGGAIGGPFGAVLGRAIGGVAGYALDQQHLSKDQVIQGPRLGSSRILTSSEGASIPRTYGQTRLGGQIIWATRFLELKSTSKSSAGGKGGGGAKTKVTKFSYYCSFAVGIADGPISGIRRVWADGQELDLTSIEYRLHRGTEDQLPDPLIEAKQGAGNAPAYRGTAYIVFENLPLASYGNRVPQISVEVLRTVDSLGDKIKSISIIPGATEFGYLPQHQARQGGRGVTSPGNRHNSIALSDWHASIDELQMLCPNLESVSLVVAWFGTDLRAGECQILPGVENASDPTTLDKWQVSGTSADNAYEVTRVDGNPAYGGTPSDHSVLRAIADLKSRGLKVTLYPFVLMDIPEDNSLPDPYGGQKQAAYPWRGMVTCHPAIGQPATVDQTSQAADQISSFTGTAVIGDFSIAGQSVNYTGAAEWSYRRLILHYAKLGELAGGLDGFIIGSEMRSLTSVRDDNGVFRFVDELIALATDTKSILGSSCGVTYAADWSEYSGYQPPSAPGDKYFNLDPLWASASIDVVGIDNYMPLTDARDDDGPQIGSVDAPWTSIEHMRANIAGGEGYNWYYASTGDRLDRQRTSITDGLGEPWVWRYKDLVSWWSNPHHERIGGVRQTTTTPWQPQAKPIQFTELGCPAIDKGSNQPNVFYDAKSDQSALPYFSSGGRDDLIQNRFLRTHYKHWDESDPDFIGQQNPLSTQYTGRMIDPSTIALWAWDARPFPWFPSLTDTWSDGPNWQRGHWLNGRLAGCPLDSLISTIMRDFGFFDFRCEVDGHVDGYVVPNATSLRSALEPLLSLFGVLVSEEAGQIVFRSKSYCPRAQLESHNLVHLEEAPTSAILRDQETELPNEALITHASISGSYEQAGTKTSRQVSGSERQITMSVPMVASGGTASATGEERIRDMWIAREKLKLGVTQKHAALMPGDIITLDDDAHRKWIVEQTDTGLYRELQARAMEYFPKTGRNEPEFGGNSFRYLVSGPPLAELLDLAWAGTSSTGELTSHLAVFASPWSGPYSAYSSASENGFELRGLAEQPAILGELLDDLAPGPHGRWDLANAIKVSLYSETLQFVDTTQVLNGANALAVQCDDGGWEILQFTEAELQGDGSWTVSRLLRAQFGTEAEMYSGASAGNRIVILDGAIQPITLSDHERSLELNWRIGPADEPYSADTHITLRHNNRARFRQPLSPVHLTAGPQPNGDISLSWIRRSRVDADSWEAADIPLGEETERYRIRVLDGGGAKKRMLETPLPQQIYSHQMRTEDFGTSDGPFTFEISQIATSGLPGAEAFIDVVL